MPEKKDVFTILAELRRRVLGISDQKPSGIEGFLVSFLPTGQPINPDDFTRPWKPNMTTPSAVKPPEQPGPEDTSDIGKRYENLANTCTLVDNKIRLNDVYQVIPNSSTISQAWEVIVNGANVMPLPPEQEEFQKKQRAKYLPRLRKTIKDDNDEDMEVDTKEYKAYQEYMKKYQKAVRDYANQYMIAMSNKQTAHLWGVTGKTYIADVDSAWEEWQSLGYKQFIEEAKDNLAAMGTDAAAHMIAMAKKKFEAYRIATQGVIPVTSQYVELFPSNWADTKVEEDGWSEYEYSWNKETITKEAESTAFGGSAGISIGFWSAKASASHERQEEHNDMQVDGLEIKFKYALVDINRPWLDTILFDMGNWFLVGDHPKGCISNGQMNQVFPSNGDAAAWLPIIPKQIVVIKDLYIKTNHIHEHFDSLKTKTSAGGSFGIGPFSLSGQYSHSKSTSTQTAEKEGEGLRVKGIQILGWISHLVPMSPKLDAPKEEIAQPTGEGVVHA